MFKSIHHWNVRLRLFKDKPRALEENPCTLESTLSGSLYPREEIDDSCVDQRGIVANRQSTHIKIAGDLACTSLWLNHECAAQNEGLPAIDQRSVDLGLVDGVNVFKLVLTN